MSHAEPLTIGIDISSVLYGRGVSRYTSNLVQALQAHTNLHLELFGNSLRRKNELKDFAKKIGKTKHLRAYSVPPKALSLLWYKLHWPDIQQFLPKVQVFHAWEELVPPSKNIPVVATIHDLAILKYPKSAHPATRYRHAQAWKRLKEINAHIIAVSQSTKDDVIEYLDIPSHHVHLIYEALPNERKLQVSSQQLNMVKVEYDVLRPYLLWVGTHEPRKNLERLVEAWQPLAKDIDLVLVGAQGWGVNFNSFKYLPKVLGYIEDVTLSALYAGAQAFVFPSLDEGFGLPILEAFYYKVPVVTSDRSAMKEIAGNAAVLTDPENPQKLTKAIEKILNENSQEKKRREQAMIQRLQIFSWTNVAQATQKVYYKASQQHS